MHHLSPAQGGTGTAGARRPGARGRVAGAEPRLGEQHHTRSQDRARQFRTHQPPPNTSESDVPRNRAWKALQRLPPLAAMGGAATPPERIHGPPEGRAGLAGRSRPGQPAPGPPSLGTGSPARSSRCRRTSEASATSTACGSTPSRAASGAAMRAGHCTQASRMRRTNSKMARSTFDRSISSPRSRAASTSARSASARTRLARAEAIGSGALAAATASAARRLSQRRRASSRPCALSVIFIATPSTIGPHRPHSRMKIAPYASEVPRLGPPHMPIARKDPRGETRWPPTIARPGGAPQPQPRLELSARRPQEATSTAVLSLHQPSARQPQPRARASPSKGDGGGCFQPPRALRASAAGAAAADASACSDESPGRGCHCHDASIIPFVCGASASAASCCGAAACRKPERRG